MNSTSLEQVGIFLSAFFSGVSFFFFARQLVLARKRGLTPNVIRDDYKKNKLLWLSCGALMFFSSLGASYFHYASIDKAASEWKILVQNSHNNNINYPTKHPHLEVNNPDYSIENPRTICSKTIWSRYTVHINGKITVLGINLENTTFGPHSIVVNGNDLFQVLYLMCQN